MLEILLICTALLCSVFLCTWWKRRRKVPPGPTGYPLCGNTFQIDSDRLHHQLKEMSDTYGPVFKLNIMGSNVVTVTSSKLLTSLFELSPGNAITNDRSVNSTLDVFYKRKHMGCANLTKETSFLREIHKNDIQNYFDGREYFELKMRDEVRRLRLGLINQPTHDVDPHQYLRDFYRNVCSLLLIGTTIPDSDPENNVLWDFVDNLFILVDPSVDGPLRTFPFLKHLPGYYGDVYRDTIAARNNVTKRYFDDQKMTFIPGRVRGLVDVCLQKQLEHQSTTGSHFFTDDYIKGLILDTLAAGMTELMKSVRLFMLLMCHFPDVQARIHVEIDTIIGTARYPKPTDRKLMPYTWAVLLEVWRYGSQTPLAIPHLCKSDVILEDFLIENGSVIFPNLYGIHHDKEIWGDPWDFRPDRFLDESGLMLPSDHVYMQNVIPFSVGERACPGQDFARSRTFVTVTSLLQRVRLLPPEGATLPSADPRLYTRAYPLHEPKYRCRVLARESLVI